MHSQLALLPNDIMHVIIQYKQSKYHCQSNPSTWPLFFFFLFFFPFFGQCAATLVGRVDQLSHSRLLFLSLINLSNFKYKEKEEMMRSYIYIKRNLKYWTKLIWFLDVNNIFNMLSEPLSVWPSINIFRWSLRRSHFFDRPHIASKRSSAQKLFYAFITALSGKIYIRFMFTRHESTDLWKISCHWPLNATPCATTTRASKGSSHRQSLPCIDIVVTELHAPLQSTNQTPPSLDPKRFGASKLPRALTHL
jgi:hypothetical protein